MVRMVAPLKEATMKMIQSVFTQLQYVMDALVGVRPFQPLPEAFFQQPDWHEAAQDAAYGRKRYSCYAKLQQKGYSIYILICTF